MSIYAFLALSVIGLTATTLAQTVSCNFIRSTQVTTFDGYSYELGKGCFIENNILKCSPGNLGCPRVGLNMYRSPDTNIMAEFENPANPSETELTKCASCGDSVCISHVTVQYKNWRLHVTSYLGAFNLWAFGTQPAGVSWDPSTATVSLPNGVSAEFKYNTYQNVITNIGTFKSIDVKVTISTLHKYNPSNGICGVWDGIPETGSLELQFNSRKSFDNLKVGSTGTVAAKEGGNALFLCWVRWNGDIYFGKAWNTVGACNFVALVNGQPQAQSFGHHHVEKDWRELKFDQAIDQNVYLSNIATLRFNQNIVWDGCVTNKDWCQDGFAWAAIRTSILPRSSGNLFACRVTSGNNQYLGTVLTVNGERRCHYEYYGAQSSSTFEYGFSY